MGFYHGKASRVYLNGYNLSSYFDSADMPMNADTVETTCFNMDDKEYIMGNKTATISAEGFYDGSTQATEEVLSAAFFSTNRWSYYPYGDTIGYFGYSMSAINNAYGVKGSITGAVRVSAAGQSQVGKERIVSLKALAQTTLSTSATAVDNSAGTTNGSSAYLHVTANASTDLYPYIEHSGSGSTWDTLVDFSSSTGGRTSERVTVTGEVKQYVRASWTSTAAATFQVGFCRK